MLVKKVVLFVPSIVQVQQKEKDFLLEVYIDKRNRTKNLLSKEEEEKRVENEDELSS